MEVNIGDKQLWIGMNDRGQEGNFRLVNGTAYDVTDINQPALYRWHSGEPNNSDKYGEVGEDCVLIALSNNDLGIIGLNDSPCDLSRSSFYGLCEILSYKCIPN